MPAHKVSAVELVDTLQRLERSGEEPSCVVPFGDDQFLIVTRFVNPMAKRLATLTHAARTIDRPDKWDRDPLLHSFLTDQIVTDEVAE